MIDVGVGGEGRVSDLKDTIFGEKKLNKKLEARGLAIPVVGSIHSQQGLSSPY